MPERQLEAHGAEARRRTRRRSISSIGDAAGAVGQQHHAVVGRALAVDGDGVERVVDRLAQRPVEQRLRHGRIGRDEAEHRRHHRLDHAGALGHAADA